MERELQVDSYRKKSSYEVDWNSGDLMTREKNCWNEVSEYIKENSWGEKSALDRNSDPWATVTKAGKHGGTWGVRQAYRGAGAYQSSLPLKLFQRNKTALQATKKQHRNNH